MKKIRLKTDEEVLLQIQRKVSKISNPQDVNFKKIFLKRIKYWLPAN